MTPPRLGPYRLVALLGRGAMGSVWSAVHEPTGQHVAVKVLGLAEPTAAQRESLRREVRAIARLDHPHVVMIFDHGLVPSPAPPGLAAGTPWLAMELAEGDLLHRKPTTWRGIRRALLDVLAGLAHVHARGLVHRDLKPENVLAVQESWKLADLGIAHALRGESDGATSRAAGSPAYMAPEQLRGDLERQGPATDLYAVGCVGWELATGAPPFVRPTVSQVARAHLTEALPPFPGGPVPDGFGAWLASLLVKDPARRTRFAADAADALRAMPDVEAGSIEVLGRASVTTWSTVTADSWESDLPDDPTQEHASLPPASVPLDWRAGSGRAALRPRHGAELALAGLRSPPLFGRESAQDLLWTALRDTRATGRPGLVVVSGPGGAGRTALLRWFAERAIETGAATPCLRTRGGGDALPDPDLPAERPTLLLLDDALSDPDGLALALRVLRARAVVARPWLVVASESAEVLAEPDAPRDLDALRTAAGPAGREVALGPLRDEDLEALVQSLVHLDDAAMVNLVHLSGGWPRDLVGLVAELVRAGAVASGRTGYHVASPAALDAAARVTRTGLDRVDALLAGRPDEARALELCAAVRVPLPDDTWRALFASAGLDVGDDLGDRLLDHGVAEGEPKRWGLVRGTLRGAIEQRARATGRWPAACEAGARHLADHPDLEHHVGRMWFDAGAWEACLEPLASLRTRAETCREVLQSLELRERAMHHLGIPPEDDRWAYQLERQCRAMHTRGALEACGQAAQRLLDASRRHGWRIHEGTAQSLLGALETLGGGDGVARARAAWEVHRQHGTPLQRANVQLNLITALTHGERPQEALELTDEWLSELEPGTTNHAIALRVRGIALIFLGRIDEAEVDTHAALAIDTAHTRWNGAGFSAQALGVIALDREDPEAGARWQELALAHHLRAGNLYGARNALINGAECRLRLGAYDEAEALAAQGGDLSTGMGFGDTEPRLVACDAAIRRDDLDAARRRLPDPAGYSRSSRMELLLRDLAVRARLALPDEAAWRGFHRELVERAAALTYVASQIPVLVEHTAHAWVAAGRPDLAAEAAAFALPHLDRHAPERAEALRSALGNARSA